MTYPATNTPPLESATDTAASASPTYATPEAAVSRSARWRPWVIGGALAAFSAGLAALLVIAFDLRHLTHLILLIVASIAIGAFFGPFQAARTPWPYRVPPEFLTALRRRRDDFYREAQRQRSADAATATASEVTMAKAAAVTARINAIENALAAARTDIEAEFGKETQT